MKKFLKNNLLLIYIIFNILFVFINSIIDTYEIFSLNVISSTYLYMFVANFTICFLMLIYKRCIKRDYTFKLVDLMLLFMIITGCISTIYSIKPDVSWTGFIIRKEGFYTLVYYYTLFFLTRFVKYEHKKYIIWTILLIGLFEVLYASLQKCDLRIVRTYKKGTVLWAYGTFINPNFYSTYMVLCIGFSLGLYIDLKEKLYKVLYGLLSIIFCYGLLLGNTMSCVIGLIVMFIYALIYSLKNKGVLRLLLLGIIMVVLTVVLCYFKQSFVIKDMNILGGEIKEIKKGNANNSFGTNRIGIWKKSIELVPKYIWHGAGIDTFYYMFGEDVLIINNKLADKAHNEYLQILLTEGIFALIAYILFYFIIIMKGLKNNIYFMLPVIGYLVQAFFNISVISVAPFFFISLGMLYKND